MNKKSDAVKLSTEEKFKEAARIVFTKKGYAATKTRDIAEEAGMNLSLLNYYFRSKEKLFEIVMQEKLQQLFAFISPVFDQADTSLDEKIDTISANYVEMLLKNPDLPIFVLSEVKNNPERLGESIRLETYLLKSHFVRQLAEKKKDINPLQFFISFLGMMVFPFVIKPVLVASGALSKEVFNQMMEERKVLIASWMKLMLK